MNEQELLKRYQPEPGKVVEYATQLWQARYTPCGRFIVAGGYDGKVHRWKVSDDGLTALAPLAGHDGWVQAIACKGERLFTADSWGRLACWNYADTSGKPLWQHPTAHAGWIRCVAASPTDDLVATCGNDRIARLWRASDGAIQHELPEHEEKLFSACFHPAGDMLLTGDLKGVIRQWDWKNAKVVMQFDAGILYRQDRIQQCGGARHLAFNAAGDRLLCAGQKTPSGGFATGVPTVILFDYNSGAVVQEMQHGGNDEGFVYDAQFHPDGFVMASASAFPGKGQFWFWQPGQPKPFYIGKGLTNGHSFSVHPGGQWIAFLMDVAANGNGRQLKDGKYPGGSAKIHLLRSGEAAA